MGGTLGYYSVLRGISCFLSTLLIHRGLYLSCPVVYCGNIHPPTTGLSDWTNSVREKISPCSICSHYSCYGEVAILDMDAAWCCSIACVAACYTHNTCTTQRGLTNATRTQLESCDNVGRGGGFYAHSYIYSSANLEQEGDADETHHQPNT